MADEPNPRCIIGPGGIISFEIHEGDRQLVLLALAELSLRSPGFDDALNRIAMRIDNIEAGRAKLYDDFRRINARAER